MELTLETATVIAAIIAATGTIIAAIIAVIARIKKVSSDIRVEGDDCESKVVHKQNNKIPDTDPDDKIPISLAGWASWGGINVTRRNNENIINNIVRRTAGLNNANLDKNMSGKKLLLKFSNTKKTKFNQGRMIKLTVNKNDDILKPDNRTVIFDGYLSAEDTPTKQWIEYTIPEDFDGKLGFTFYQVELNNLIIKAFYK